MADRTTLTTVTFSRSFVIDGFDQELPAGDYTVETEEELLRGLSVPGLPAAIAPTLHVDRIPGHPGLKEAWRIDPEALDAHDSATASHRR